MADANLYSMIFTAAFIVLMLVGLYTYIWWEHYRPAKKMEKKLRKLGYKIHRRDGPLVSIRTLDPGEWDWAIVLFVFGFEEDEVILDIKFGIPRGHPLKEYEGDNFYEKSTAARTSFDQTHEAIGRVLNEAREFLDEQVTKREEAIRPVKWADVHSLSSVARDLRDALQDVPEFDRIEPDIEQLRQVCEAFKDIAEREWELKEKDERKDVDWVQIEEGPAAGYHIAVVPLEEGDIGHKDEWKGILKEKTSTGSEVQTTSPYKDGALEGIQEIVEILIDEGTMEPQNE